MIGTIISIIFAALLYASPFHVDGSSSVKVVIVTAAFAFLLIIPLSMLLSWQPMQKAEQNSTPRVMETYRQDRTFGFCTAWLFAFFLIVFILVTDPIYTYAMEHDWLFPLLLVLFGVSFDVVCKFIRRISSYLNPFSVVKMFKERAQHCIQADRELDLCDWIDALSEVAIKGVQRHSTSVGHLALQEEQMLARSFLGASKSIGHRESDNQMKAAGITDKVSFTMFYLYQRLDIVFEKALHNKLEPTCTLIVTIFGKIALDAAKYDMTLASAPLRYLGKCAEKAQQQSLDETAGTAACVLFEVAKEILTEVDITYYEIKDLFLSIINGMETLAKGAFRKDKTISIAILEQPFKDLAALFKNEKVQGHQDAPIIVQNIDRVLGEFDALLLVMNTMPPLPKVEETTPPS